MTLADHLREIGACGVSRDWAIGRTAREAWQQCHRPDWLIWWQLTDRPDTVQALVLLLARKVRGWTVRYVPESECAACELALCAAERWAMNPTTFNEFVAGAAAKNAYNAGFYILGHLARVAAPINRRDRIRSAISVACALNTSVYKENSELSALIREAFPDPPWSEEKES